LVIASQAEAENGTDQIKTMTAQRTRQAIDSRVVIATEQEAINGVVTNKYMTPFLTSLVLSNFNPGQTWQDVKASRTFNTTYTNNTTRPIQVHVSFAGWTNTDFDDGPVNEALLTFEISEDGTTWISFGSSIGSQVIVSPMVPAGSLYRLRRTFINTPFNQGSIGVWNELR